MNKQELIQAVADKSGLTQKDAKTALDATLAVVSDTLAQGDEVVLVGFGTFSVREQKARTGRNPQTGEKIQVPAKKVPSFKAGKGLKEAVN
ncbi:MAG: HU family DNA-binding protein [Moraxella sp.]|uniref:HU family DNA-binding protein n=2 Tax=Moraxella nasicaprae TaxID=2904122 RepID=A0ABY6F455_9GAMM|nr:HU family DNA-binding protein [Moraxella sp.]MDO4450815.1 HU family DNA-binding protein [Moraxella sp.]UXZ04838.1 HU family DNA-binding protein [Moraxella nasicaprae]